MEFEQFNSAEDTQSDAEKIDKYTGDVDWSYLQSHFEAGNVIGVSAELALADVALAFAEDNKASVQSWLASGGIFQPNESHAAQWKGNGSRFNVTIVRPFILVQEIAG